jgi:hypothetical protein
VSHNHSDHAGVPLTSSTCQPSLPNSFMCNPKSQPHSCWFSRQSGRKSSNRQLDAGYQPFALLPTLRTPCSYRLLLSGDLPVLLAVEASAGRIKTVLAEPSVLDTLQQHRLAELKSTGKNRSNGCTWCNTTWQLIAKHAGAAAFIWDTGHTCAIREAAADQLLAWWPVTHQSSWLRRGRICPPCRVGCICCRPLPLHLCCVPALC